MTSVATPLRERVRLKARSVTGSFRPGSCPVGGSRGFAALRFGPRVLPPFAGGAGKDGACYVRIERLAAKSGRAVSRVGL